MANFQNMRLTNAGLNLLTAVQAGADNLTFTKMILGDGELSTPISMLTAPVSPKIECVIDSGKRVGDNTYQIGAFFSNTSITVGFWWRELAIYAKGNDENEVLYCYANAGDAGDYIPVGSDERIEKYIYVSLSIGNAENVTIEISGSDTFIPMNEKGKAGGVAPLGENGKIGNEYLPKMDYASNEQFGVLVNDLTSHKNATNPHNITATTVGLGKVPNVTTNDQTPTYTVATTLTSLVSGEKLGVAFGKIKKAITDLMSHIADTTKHITSTERTTWESMTKSGGYKLLKTQNISTGNVMTSGEATVQITGVNLDNYSEILLRFDGNVTFKNILTSPSTTSIGNTLYAHFYHSNKPSYTNTMSKIHFNTVPPSSSVTTSINFETEILSLNYIFKEVNADGTIVSTNDYKKVGTYLSGGTGLAKATYVWGSKDIYFAVDCAASKEATTTIEGVVKVYGKEVIS